MAAIDCAAPLRLHVTPSPQFAPTSLDSSSSVTAGCLLVPALRDSVEPRVTASSAAAVCAPDAPV
ncbi:hypothetical protein CHLRE_05g232455v5 [Chlamydomonas reinhardtii]|uniref:Uncharacterized protein n=1 Tax=Chlamydomonas reinhardtii TaxID=3055 RepID=A0A2K3DRX1_CHLRE|nr:uncharacterized protein CHLRE_05g232455v5 [Chlamydomonas reinhardtii]PNW83280.1 hypothetical protein CHLRE_05g232455v5 [Chlamydomonas reinhardtii]